MTAETTPQAAPINEARIVAFARDVCGLTLYPKQAEILSEMYDPAAPVRTAVWRLGRRSGKDRMASIVCAFEASVNAEAHLRCVPADEQVEILLVATSQKQARVCMRYIASYFKRGALGGLVAKSADDELTLTNNVVVRTMPATSAAARGSGVAVFVLSEAAHFVGSDGSPVDVQAIWSALTPATSAYPERRIIVASTPKWQSDFFARLCQRAERGDDPTMRAWHESTATMNPGIDPAWLASEEAADPENYRREYLAEYLAGVSAALDPDLVRSAATGEERPPVEGVRYAVSLDPAYASGGDRFACIVGHVEGDVTIVDRLASWAGSRGSPVPVEATLSAISELAAVYGNAEIVSDQFASAPLVESLTAKGARVQAVPWSNESKMQALTLLRRGLYQNKIVLPRHAGLVGELCNLEVRQTPGGKARVAAAGSGHDDWATALMGLLLKLEGPAEPGVLGVWKAMVAGWTPGQILPQTSQPLPAAKPSEPPKEWTVKPAPELARAQCPVSLRVDNAPVRCSLWHGHPGECVPVVPV